MSLLPRRQPGHQGREHVALFPAAPTLAGSVANEGEIGALRCLLHRRPNPGAEEGCDLLQPLHPLVLLEALLVRELQHQRVLTIHNLLPHARQDGGHLPRDAIVPSEAKDPLQCFVQVLLISVTEPGDIAPNLVLNVGGFAPSERQRLARRSALHRLELRVLQREPQQRRGKPVDEKQCRDGAPGQKCEVRPEAVGQKRDARVQPNRSQRHLRERELLVVAVHILPRARPNRAPARNPQPSPLLHLAMHLAMHVAVAKGMPPWQMAWSAPGGGRRS
eukprot:CAMPEP_0198237476 /NCGR_PEP_ID=MMETSP1446-20131203/3312_1 /TAXON_ID=1461542 ORGANISM="Unidentified sp, Strain CCMP2111" /NCGR_SAMPLE_ID=MMETSP1446 /ASSEMBLY_ACC=CAM_ASM_001112 /LENGTH=275 /DNA_ID=CAMNT_0043919643 /DNA_START=301 /DNA_END=1125 /DNA_ORIENTATION=+